MSHVVLSALATAGALSLAACGNGGSSTTTRTAPSDAVGTVATGAPKDLAPRERRANADGVAVLRASRPPVSLRLVLVEIVDPAPPTASFSPQRDNRFVSVGMRVRNEGAATYTDTVSSGASIVDARGESHPAAVVNAAEPALGRVTLAAGESVSGFLTFEIPKTARPAELRVRLNSGFGPDTGVWALP